MLLALMWHHAGGGKGLKDMVVLPYKDRLVLFSKYLQQLVMESLGKEHDLDGAVVNQGIAVYGNKGSTDQHAYVQQLRDGVNNFFATFIEVRKARDTAPLEVDPGFTSGDYLQGFLRGTRKALADKGRESVTLSIEEVSAFTLGMLVGLFERAVGFLCQPREHQCLPSAGRGGRKESRHRFPQAACPGAQCTDKEWLECGRGGRATGHRRRGCLPHAYSPCR
jgi:glucose-6-phosphate isomerase